jgi:hypothetical protein
MTNAPTCTSRLSLLSSACWCREWRVGLAWKHQSSFKIRIVFRYRTRISVTISFRYFFADLAVSTHHKDNFTKIFLGDSPMKSLVVKRSANNRHKTTTGMLRTTAATVICALALTTSFQSRRPLGICPLLRLLRLLRQRLHPAAAHLEQQALLLPLALLALLPFWRAMICSVAQPASATSWVLVAPASPHRSRQPAAM